MEKGGRWKRRFLATSCLESFVSLSSWYRLCQVNGLWTIVPGTLQSQDTLKFPRIPDNGCAIFIDRTILRKCREI
jgi:hypothetical protein